MSSTILVKKLKVELRPLNIAWKLSNTMDITLTTSVLKEALALHQKPDIFNTDQGSRPSKATTPHEGG